jgi:hypothetical protein
MTQVEITANEMADEFGINQKSFRRGWTVRRGSEDIDMKRALDRLRSKLPKSSK